MTAKGAVACGHPATAAAAEEILRDGGNAFDAVLAAFAAATVAETVLSSLGGGGFMLAQPAGGEGCLYDFFVDTPLAAKPESELDFFPVHADFGPARQEFHIGLGACATPGGVKGLFAIHRDLASLPMARILEPAIALARAGSPVRAMDAFLFSVVAPILLARPGVRDLHCGADGALLQAGAAMRQPALADSLEALASEGEALFYQGELAQRLVAVCAERGGHLTAADLANYRVMKRRPLARDYRGTRILTNPPPSAGGILIAFALDLLDPYEVGRMPAAGAAQLLGRVQDLTNKARRAVRLEEALGEADEAAAAARLFDPGLLEDYRREVLAHAPATRGTTHISVIDAAGNMAAMSLSNGEGCGEFLPGSGIILNNMLGEEDLTPAGFHNWPGGARMSSMMAPTLAIKPDGHTAALGSGGSNRIRSAILQVLLRLIDHGDAAETAVAAPRLHVERGQANMEQGLPEGTAEGLAAQGLTIKDWPYGNLFFGGVHSVTLAPDGRLAAAGDPRRGGVGLVVG